VSVALRRIVGFLLAGVLIVADQAIKYAVFHRTNIYQPVELTPFFRIAYTENYGVSLGLLKANTLEMRWLLLGLTGTIAAAVLYWIFKERKLGDILALSLVLGGAVGNILDRMRSGYVVDYADLHFGEWRPFLIFNLADVCITFGVLIILARSLFSREKPSAAADAAPET
jgi:signal peptidase II